MKKEFLGTHRLDLAIRARLAAIFHKILHPIHNLVWQCRGSAICCHTCNRIYWDRLYELDNEALQKECEE